ncbi:MAG: NAD(P)H-dependent oxidoreductase [Bacteroidales bacterium]|nr:NAD(P)H-dependent oxidoreductase [Bacteroidales bacterium]
MKTLIILAHPEIDKSIANKRITEMIQSKVDHVDVRSIADLYPDFKIDIATEQKNLLEYDTIVFQYPFFWYNMPAILKHWFDEVFNFNFAYGPEGDKLKGKNFLLSFTIGGPQDAYTPQGYNHFRIPQFLTPMEQTAYLAQMNYLEPVYEHGMVYIPGVYNTREAVERRADKHANKIIDTINSLANSAPEIKIKNFVKDWFANMDKLADDGYFNAHIANNAKLVFPEGEFTGHEGFSEWYNKIKQMIKPDCQHTIEALSVIPNNGHFNVNLSVYVKGESPNNKPIQIYAKENWKVEITRDHRIKIHEYIVESL